MAVPSQLPAQTRVEFGDWFRAKRKALGKKQEEVADEAGMSRLQILRIENGQSGTTEENLPKLAVAIGVSVAEIKRRYYGKGIKVEPDEELTLILNTVPEPKRSQFIRLMREAAAML